MWIVLDRCAQHLEERAIESLHLAITLRVKGRGMGLLDAGKVAQLMEELTVEVLPAVTVDLPGKPKQGEEIIVHGPHTGKRLCINQRKRSRVFSEVV